PTFTNLCYIYTLHPSLLQPTSQFVLTATFTSFPPPRSPTTPPCTASKRLDHAVASPAAGSTNNLIDSDRSKMGKLGFGLLKGSPPLLSSRATQNDPIVAAILDGKVIKMLLEDEDDYAMLAENLFTDLDTEDEGKLSKNQIRGALELMKVEMGVPPFSEFPELNDMIKKHGAEGEEMLGQAQFAELLQPVLQDIADALAEKHVILVQNIKIINGSKLKKLLADDNQLNEIVQKIYTCNQTKQEETKSIEAIRSYMETNGKEIGLLPLEDNEVVTLLFDSVFSSVDKQKRSSTLANKDEFLELLKDIMLKFVGQLEVNPVFYDDLED
ncbi:hypothetical protein V2J09_007920, partial [Rumex salicifolius]